MPLDTKTFTDQFVAAIAGRPDELQLARVIIPFIKRLKQAEADGNKNEIAVILGEMKVAVRAALGLEISGDEPDESFTNKSYLIQGPEGFADVRGWVDAEYEKRMSTHLYFGFTNYAGINGTVYAPPTNASILAAMTLPQLELIRTFERPILVMTPISVAMQDLVTAFDSQKGAMKVHNASMNSWGTILKLRDFNYDRKNLMTYGNFGVSKMDLIADSQNSSKGWRVLAVEGSDEVPDKDCTADYIVEKYRKEGFVGLTPEDELMLQAVGLRMGKPFGSTISPVDGRGYNFWLTGASLADRVPCSRWDSDSSRIEYSHSLSDDMTVNHSSRRAVRIL